MELVRPYPSLNSKIKTNKIVTKAVKRLKEELTQADINDNKFSHDYINYVYDLVANANKKKYEKGTDELVMDVIAKLLPSLTDADKARIVEIIQHLVKANMIHVVPFSKKLVFKLLKLFLTAVVKA